MRHQFPATELAAPIANRIARRTALTCLTAAALAVVAASCNVFDPLDGPSGDRQLLSAARASLDNGDYDRALEYYGQLSADQADVKASEEAYAILKQNGAGFGAFASAFGTEPNGKGLTALANDLVAGSGEARRLAIHSAYKKWTGITDTNLKNLVRFLGAVALAGEILAEVAGTDGTLSAADLVATPSGCTSVTTCATTQLTACGAGTSTFDSTTATHGNITSDDPSGSAPTLDQLYYAISEATNGLNELGSSSTSSFSDLLGGQSSAPSENAISAACFRAGLLSQGIGS